MAKGDEKRAQRMIDAQAPLAQQRNDILFNQNYGQYQNPQQQAPQVPDRNPGPGNAVPRGTGVGPTQPPTGGQPNTGQPADPRQPGTPVNQGQRMTDAEAQAFFDKMFPGEKLSPEDLEAHRAELEAAGFVLNPNAAGRITDLTLPSGNTVDPIIGAGSGQNQRAWMVHQVSPGGGPAEGNFTGKYGDYGGGLLSPALGGYRNFAESGGFSPQDITNIRARSNAPIRAMYQQGMDEIDRSKNLSGGYAPNFAPAMAKMQREQSYRIGDQSLNTEAELANQIRTGRLAGLGGLSQTGLSINQQGLAAGALADESARGWSTQQQNKSRVPTNFQQAVGNVAGPVDVFNKIFRGKA